MTTSNTFGVGLNAFTEVPPRHPQLAAKAKKQPRLRRGMMMRLPISSLQILFLTWVTSIEHYWVTLRERRGRGRRHGLVERLKSYSTHIAFWPRLTRQKLICRRYSDLSGDAAEDMGILRVTAPIRLERRTSACAQIPTTLKRFFFALFGLPAAFTFLRPKG